MSRAEDVYERLSKIASSAGVELPDRYRQFTWTAGIIQPVILMISRQIG